MKYNFDEIVNRKNTNCLKYDLLKPFFGTEDVLPMWVADMDFPTPDFIVDAVKKRAEHPIFGYSIRTTGFYNAIIQWMKKRHNWEIAKKWILFSPGIVPALNISILAYTEPGDKIIVQSPVYFPFFHSIQNNKRHVVYNPLVLKNGRYYMDFDHLKSVIDSNVKMIFLCNPHNPGGSCWKKEELTELANICIKNNIIIISDEIHSDLIFAPNRHVPVASLSNDIAAITVTCMAPSKTFNVAGLASAVVIIQNKDLFEKYKAAADRIHISDGNIFGTVALEAAYTYGESWLDEMLHYLQGTIDLIMAYFQENIPSIIPIRPEATYMVWLDCRALGMAKEELKHFFITKCELGLSDGPLFGPGGEGFQRMNFACSRIIVKDALERILKALQ